MPNILLSSMTMGVIHTLAVVATTTGTGAASAGSSSSSSSAAAIINAQKAEQANLDESAPMFILLAIGGLFLLCVLILHPRFLARLFASSSRSSSKPSATRPHALGEKSSGWAERTVGGGGLWQGWYLRRGAAPSSNPFASPHDERIIPHLHPPPHIVPLLSHLPFSSSLHFAPFARLPNILKSSITLVELLIIVAYLTSVAFALIWRSDLSPATKTSGYGADFKRQGMVTAAQLPVVVLLGVRGNLVGLFVGKGYEKLKVYHKIVGRTIAGSATIHAVGYLYTWAAAGKLSQQIKQPFVICGLVGYSSLVLIAITSLPWIRKAMYGVFEVCHFVGIMSLLIGLCYHVDEAVPFCVAALLVYLASIICTLTKTRLGHAQLQALPGADTTIVTIPALRSGWRAGQHVRIRVPTLGLPHGFESHPFTIASAPDGEGLVLMCKKAGNWTERLFALAQKSDTEMASSGRQVTVLVEGPYGGMGNTMVPSFSSTAFIAGGSGITSALGLAHDLVLRAPTGVVRARTIDLIWVVRTEEAARPLIPILSELVTSAKSWEVECLEGRRRGEDKPQPTALRVQVFVTHSPASSPLNLVAQNPFLAEGESQSEADKEKYAYLQRNPSSASTATFLSGKTKKYGRDIPLSNITAVGGRPNLGGLVNFITEETIARHARTQTNASGICVSACGPTRLTDSVREAVRKVEGYKQRAVGGIEFELEQFGF